MSFWSLAAQVYAARTVRRAERVRALEEEERRRREAREHRRNFRLNLLLAIVTIAGIGISAVWFASDVRARPEPPTAIDVFDFFSRDVSALTPIEANCFDFAITTTRGDAHRCFAENLVLDPCFEGSGTAPWVLLCPAMLNTGRYGDVMVTTSEFTSLEELHGDPSQPPEVEQSIGLEGDLPSLAPWAIELEDNNRCVFTSGATWAISHTRLNFVCDVGFVFGMPDKSEQTWTAVWMERYEVTVPSVGGESGSVTVPVRRAWL